ncbi:hypothetical protein NSQ26_07620 [Bacillus sp. FSL W7-1360]
MDREELQQFLMENLLTKREAMKVTRQKNSTFKQAVRDKRLNPFFRKGNGRSQVNLYLKEDAEAYCKRADKRRPKGCP